MTTGKKNMPTTRGALEARAKAPLPTVGSVQVVKRHGGTFHAEVLEVETKDGATRCYVHYMSFDRRMDEWVSVDQFDLRPVVEKPQTRTASRKRGPRGGPRETGNSHTKKICADDPSLAERFEAAREAMTRVKNVPAIVFSTWEIETWYWSPFPDEYHGSKLYVCDFTLRYTTSKQKMIQHSRNYQGPRHPPGNRVYKGSDGISLWEVKGKDEQLYCQNLCLIAKLFLDHKTLYYDVEPFLFYVLTQDISSKKKKKKNDDDDDDDDDDDKKTKEERSEEHHVLGYFSKEPNSPDDYNLSCILTFPQYQRNGYGTLLISLSYELSKREKKRGSPEKPLSDLGKLSYRSFWTWTILTTLRKACDAQDNLDKKKDTGGMPPISRLTLEDLGNSLGIKNDDICSTLHHLNMLRQWKGQAFLCARKDDIDAHLGTIHRPPRLCEPENFIS